MLQVRDIAIAFGGVQAVRGVSFEVGTGELVGLIGPNGAGKTTVLRMLAGVLRPDRGGISFDGRDITRAAIHRRARAGIGLTHQIVRPFRSMTLVENVMIAAASGSTASPWQALFHVQRKAARDKAIALLDRLGIAEAADRPAHVLPLGFLKRMQVARALAFDPKLLLLDEPLAGLSYTEAARLADLIVALNREGRTIVLVEHNIGEVTRVVGRLLVLDNGAVLAGGAPREVMARDDVRAAYLGKMSRQNE